MTSRQIIWTTGGYAVAFIFVAYLTRAGPRRVGGALFGGGIAGLLLTEIMALWEVIGWAWQWRFEFAAKGYFPVLLGVCGAASCAPLYLITWRVARRFGWRGCSRPGFEPRSEIQIPFGSHGARYHAASKEFDWREVQCTGASSRTVLFDGWATVRRCASEQSQPHPTLRKPSEGRGTRKNG